MLATTDLRGSSRGGDPGSHLQVLEQARKLADLDSILADLRSAQGRRLEAIQAREEKNVGPGRPVVATLLLDRAANDLAAGNLPRAQRSARLGLRPPD